MDDLTGFQRDLLTIIAGLDEPKGLAIKAAYDEDYGTEVNHGRLYPNLDTLVEFGFGEKRAADSLEDKFGITFR